MSAEYAALLRRDGVEPVTVPRFYVSALGMIRGLARDDEFLSDADRLLEIGAVLDAVVRVQEDLDAREL